jgi:endonuclease/exonuclease/phosphatase family metal-dependent hydrolase
MSCGEVVPYTTWKIRESGEQRQVLDYVLHSSALATCSYLAVPDHVGEERFPSLQFPSDHLSLVVDLAWN